MEKELLQDLKETEIEEVIITEDKSNFVKIEEDGTISLEAYKIMFANTEAYRK